MNEFKSGQIYRHKDDSIVRLDIHVANTEWYVTSWRGDSWARSMHKIDTSDLVERLPDDWHTRIF